ncbi:9492_t:CDS:2 [Racocetra persica]|uniref:9492_t:CDS:1 n=1 Tax=Racocetra persica TaxID=160502 RepID=A0ACA9LK28_9GLOM|nr:9492_t:CDS:2 [Racocetra persica]
MEVKINETVTVPELELALKEFILIYQHCTILSDAMMIEKAKLLADELGVPEGKLYFSSRWLQKFKERNGICQIKLHGEADSVDKDVITESLPLLQSKYSKYPLDRIYNMDETRLFYLGQHVLLLLDNCSSHKLDELTLQYVDVYFLSKNTTSRIQPMDAGIIIAFKRAYHHFHLQWMLEQVEAGNFVQDLKIDVLQAIFANLSDDLREAGNSRLENLIRSLNTFCLPNAIETDEFLNFNSEEIVYKVFTEDQIIKKLAYVFRNDESVKVIDEGNIEVMDEEEDNSVEPTVVSGSSVLNSLKNVRMFLLQQEGSGDQLKSINFLEKFIRKMMSSSAQRTRIDEYFKT